MIPSIFLYAELNCFAIVVLVVIILNIRQRNHNYSPDQKLFLMLAIANILLLCLDVTLWIMDGRPGAVIRLLSITAIVLYNILNAVICMLWYYYVDYYVYGNKERVIRAQLPILLPVILNTLLSVASIFFNIYFFIDENNVYHRGRFIYILLGICLYIILYISVFLIQNRKKTIPKAWAYLLFFAIPPGIGGIIQFLLPGTNVIWIATTLSVYIIFINIQKEQIQTDYLTGLNNRGHLDRFLQNVIKNMGDAMLAGIMIDIDDFKSINDAHGHDQGDQALQHIAQILEKSFRKTDFIARYGGDEFVVVVKIQEEQEVAAMVQRLKKNVALFNSQKRMPYEISLSIGYDFYDRKTSISADGFLKSIDRSMYANKQKPASV